MDNVGPTPTLNRALSRPAPAEEAAGDWLCAWCLNLVANEKDRSKINGRDEFGFTNPEGVTFGIIIFAETQGCRQTGVPTLQHTWFEGCAWSYCLCRRCGQHLGWYYEGVRTFAGLIRVRLVRGLCLRN